MQLIYVAPKTGALAFLNRDQVIVTQEQVEIRDLQFARGINVHGLQDDKEVVRSVFNFGPLVSMAAILNVQRV